MFQTDFLGIFLTILTILILGFITYKSPLFHDHYWKPKHALSILAIKLIVGFVLSWIYTDYYTNRSEADIYKYYDDARLLNDVFSENPLHYAQMLVGTYDVNDPVFRNYMKYSNCWWKQTDQYLNERGIYDFNIFDDHHFLTKIHSLLLFITFDTFEIHLVLFIFLGFIGLRLINKTLDKILFEYSFFRHLLIYLFPVILAWTSIPIKEVILVFGFGLFLWNFHLFYQSFKLKKLLISVLGILLILKGKYFMGVFILPFLPFLLSRTKQMHSNIVGGIAILMFVGMLTLSPYLFVKQKENRLIINNYPNSTVVEGPQEFNSDQLNNIQSFGHALFNTYVQPLFISNNSPLVLLNKIENVVLILLILLTFLIKGNLRWDMLFLFLSALIVGGLLIGCSTLIVGNIHRYRLIPIILIISYCGQYFPFQFKVDLFKR